MPAIAQIVVCKMVNSNITFSSNHATATFCAETAARQAALNLVNITKNSIGIDGKGYSVALAGHAQILRKHTAARQQFDMARGRGNGFPRVRVCVSPSPF